MTAPKFAADFHPRTRSEIDQALGSYPWGDNASNTLRDSSMAADRTGRTTITSLNQLNNVCYYSNLDSNGKSVWKDLPNPTDDACWLATFVEAGQSFDEYVKLVTLRSGKFKPQVNIGNPIIYILPILSGKGGRNPELKNWPSNGPDLRQLAGWVRSFFDRDVIILDPTTLSVAAEKKPKRAIYAGKSTIAFRTTT